MTKKARGRQAGTAALGAAFALLLAACSSSGSSGTAAATTTTPKSGAATGTLMGAMSSGAIDTMDPNRWYFAVTWGLANAMCTTLVRYADQPGPAGTAIVPGTASLPAVTDNGLLYTFTLRPGVKFSDGQPITPADIKYSFMRLMAPAVDTGTGVYFTNLVGASAYMAGKSKDIAGITTTANTVSFHLTSPDGAFLYKAALPTTCPVPVGTAMKPIETGALEQKYASGPFELQSYSPGLADRTGLQQELQPGAGHPGPRSQDRLLHRRPVHPSGRTDPGWPARLPDLEPRHCRHHQAVVECGAAGPDPCLAAPVPDLYLPEQPGAAA